MKEFFDKVKEFVQKWFIEIGFVALSFLLLFLPFTPYPLNTYGFGMFMATILNPLIKYIIRENKK